MKHTMIDLETMGISAGCAIMSIGAVEFDPESQTRGSAFYRVVDLQSCIDTGLRIDASTLYWWMEQSEEARKALSKDQVPLLTALQDFVNWFDHNSLIWSHGAPFDLPVLQAAYEALKIPVPWKFRNARDTRTIFDLTGTRMSLGAGTYHNALDDAINQADNVIEAYQKLK